MFQIKSSFHAYILDKRKEKKNMKPDQFKYFVWKRFFLHVGLTENKVMEFNFFSLEPHYSQ